MDTDHVAYSNEDPRAGDERTRRRQYEYAMASKITETPKKVRVLVCDKMIEIVNKDTGAPASHRDILSSKAQGKITFDDEMDEAISNGATISKVEVTGVHNGGVACFSVRCTDDRPTLKVFPHDKVEGIRRVVYTNKGGNEIGDTKCSATDLMKRVTSLMGKAIVKDDRREIACSLIDDAKVVDFMSEIEVPVQGIASEKGGSTRSRALDGSGLQVRVSSDNFPEIMAQLLNIVHDADIRYPYDVNELAHENVKLFEVLHNHAEGDPIWCVSNAKYKAAMNKINEAIDQQKVYASMFAKGMTFPVEKAEDTPLNDSSDDRPQSWLRAEVTLTYDNESPEGEKDGKKRRDE